MNLIAKKKAKKATAAGKIAKNKTREFAVETLIFQIFLIFLKPKLAP